MLLDLFIFHIYTGTYLKASRDDLINFKVGRRIETDLDV